MAMEEAQPKDQPTNEEPKYGVVEIFGHRQHAGRVLEVEQFGAKMLRIDVPKTDKEGVASFDNGYETHFYGGGSIFSFSPATLETVIRMNKTYPSAGYRSLPFYDDEGDDNDPEDEPLIHGDPKQAEAEPETPIVAPITGEGLPDVDPAPDQAAE